MLTYALLNSVGIQHDLEKGRGPAIDYSRRDQSSTLSDFR